MKEKIKTIQEKSVAFLMQHAQHGEQPPFSGGFNLHRGAGQADLYGMIDAAYILYTIGLLPQLTDRGSRALWAEEILACQDAEGWFSLKNNRGHSQEHATAYALGALKLLSLEQDENYTALIKPLRGLLPLLTEEKTFNRWISSLNFKLTPKSILAKNTGWHYIWRGSHVGGGVAASIGMTQSLISEWWLEAVDVERWFSNYFRWLDAHVSARTGYWQRAFWNLVVKQPTLIDLGGAVHFLWVYQAYGNPFPYPAAVIESTLALQKPSGLYQEHPYCIDLDGNFCLIRSFLQLDDHQKKNYRERVDQSVTMNFEAIAAELSSKDFTTIYDDSHGLPGALAALIECCKLPEFRYQAEMDGWCNPLDRAWWL